MAAQLFWPLGRCPAQASRPQIAPKHIAAQAAAQAGLGDGLCAAEQLGERGRSSVCGLKGGHVIADMTAELPGAATGLVE